MLPSNHSRALVLASTSRYRRELLARLHVSFEVSAPNVDETPVSGEGPDETALRLALAKAHAVGARYADALIIGSDQVAECAGRRLDKPGNHAGAVGQLRHARGKSVTFITAVVLLDSATGRVQKDTVATECRFRMLDDAEIERYLAAEPAYDCAGSAKAEGLGISLLESVQSPDPTALIGLPLISVSRMLRQAGIIVP